MAQETTDENDRISRALEAKTNQIADLQAKIKELERKYDIVCRRFSKAESYLYDIASQAKIFADEV